MKQESCLQCHRIFTKTRNPNQKICSQTACQNARKRNWRKKKHNTDPDYRENQNRASKKWRRKNSHYWRRYRDAHPNYADRNRQQQRLRKRMRSGNPACKIDGVGFANSDALTVKNPFKTGAYRLVFQTDPEFANSDALIVNISVISNTYG